VEKFVSLVKDIKISVLEEVSDLIATMVESLVQRYQNIF